MLNISSKDVNENKETEACFQRIKTVTPPHDALSRS